MRSKPEVVAEWIAEIEVSGQNLTKWELDFVESVKEQLATRKFLSDRQIDILERIYTEKTP